TKDWRLRVTRTARHTFMQQISMGERWMFLTGNFIIFPRSQTRVYPAILRHLTYGPYAVGCSSLLLSRSYPRRRTTNPDPATVSWIFLIQTEPCCGGLRPKAC